MRRGGVLANVEHWRGLGICCCVRPADALNKERKF